MVVVIIICSAAAVSLQAFNKIRHTNPEMLEEALFRIQQQAAVVAAYCASLFGVIAALKTAKLAGLPNPTAAATAAAAAPPPGGVWGRPAREAALSGT